MRRGGQAHQEGGLDLLLAVSLTAAAAAIVSVRRGRAASTRGCGSQPQWHSLWRSPALFAVWFGGASQRRRLSDSLHGEWDVRSERSSAAIPDGL